MFQEAHKRLTLWFNFEDFFAKSFNLSQAFCETLLTRSTTQTMKHQEAFSLKLKLFIEELLLKRDSLDVFEFNLE